MKNKDKLIIKICKSVIVVFGVLTVFNVIMLVNKKSYALFQKTVKTNTVVHIETASEFPSENKGTDKLKDKVGQEGEIKGVDPEKGEVCTENCKEYRYSGTNVNNYVYFNCKNGVRDNTNCELWRIVGIFTDEKGEHLKIVKDTVLAGDDFPTDYTKDGTIYKIKGSGNSAYWNKKTGGTSANKNDWATAGLQYWLNDEAGEGYLSKLTEEAKGMIADTKYYLGSVSSYIQKEDTVVQAYNHERNGNQATWEGKVGLLYPSDYGFSADSSNWNTVLYSYFTASNTSWLERGANHSSDGEWLLSPSSYATDFASFWGIGEVYYYDVEKSLGARPVLNLESRVDITGGAGTLADPYQLG